MKYSSFIKKLKIVNCEYEIPVDILNKGHRSILGRDLMFKNPDIDGICCTNIKDINMVYDKEIEYEGKKHYQYTYLIDDLGDIIYDISIYSNLKPIDIYYFRRIEI
jgi:hypothetical protein